MTMTLSETRYILMNKNIPLAELYVSNDYVEIKKVLNIIPEYIGDINEWVRTRFLLFGRTNILNMAKLAGISTESEFLTISKAISLTDTFWVNDLKNPTTWDRVNPYKNRLSRIMAEIAIDGVSIYQNKNIASPSPQYKIDGSADKCIKRIKGINYLYKTNGELVANVHANRPYSEYFVYKLCSILGMHSYTEYTIKEYKTENGYIKPYCICPLFTDEDNGYVPICNTHYDGLGLQNLYNIMSNRDKLILREMLLLDSITLNFDRHTGNYGFIYDNNSFKIKGLSPIYDNDCALASTLSIQYKSFEEAYTEAFNRYGPKTGLGGYNEQAKIAMTKEMYNKLRSLGRIRIDKPNNSIGIEDERVEFINYIINRRIKEIIEMFK